MASTTRCGTCVPPGPSRKAAGCPLTVWASAGNWERTQVMSRAVGAAISVVCMVVSLSSHGSHEIRQHAIRGGVETGVFFGDGEAGEDVGFKIDVGRRARDLRHGIGEGDLLR